VHTCMQRKPGMSILACNIDVRLQTSEQLSASVLFIFALSKRGLMTYAAHPQHKQGQIQAVR
jgi:hypothetical protein